jgi:hypothetical protein
MCVPLAFPTCQVACMRTHTYIRVQVALSADAYMNVYMHTQGTYPTYKTVSPQMLEEEAAAAEEEDVAAEPARWEASPWLVYDQPDATHFAVCLFVCVCVCVCFFCAKS